MPEGEGKVTRYEWITSLSKERMAKILCNMNECGKCIAQEECGFRHNGFSVWLDEEVEDDEEH